MIQVRLASGRSQEEEGDEEEEEVEVGEEEEEEEVINRWWVGALGKEESGRWAVQKTEYDAGGLSSLAAG